MFIFKLLGLGKSQEEDPLHLGPGDWFATLRTMDGTRFATLMIEMTTRSVLVRVDEKKKKTQQQQRALHEGDKVICEFHLSAEDKGPMVTGKVLTKEARGNGYHVKIKFDSMNSQERRDIIMFMRKLKLRSKMGGSSGIRV